MLLLFSISNDDDRFCHSRREASAGRFVGADAGGRGEGRGGAAGGTGVAVRKP